MYLEDQGYLDPDNNTNIFCLQEIFFKEIYKQLEEFTRASNNHSLSTEGNQTPLQLFHFNLRLLQFQHLDSSGFLDNASIISHSNNNVIVSKMHHQTCQ